MELLSWAFMVVGVIVIVVMVIGIICDHIL